ncbi:hypothetical protein HanIR_Chr04g0164171 [Helianthus annuus]|nr:hypothetical protein HanIR_Chr04g0164171 [Helianthus annuus]
MESTPFSQSCLFNFFFARDKYVPYDIEHPSTPPFRSLESYFDGSGVSIVQFCDGSGSLMNFWAMADLGFFFQWGPYFSVFKIFITKR